MNSKGHNKEAEMSVVTTSHVLGSFSIDSILNESKNLEDRRDDDTLHSEQLSKPCTEQAGMFECNYFIT